MEAFDRRAAFDALMNEVGLVEPARYDRLTVNSGQSSMTLRKTQR
jgi:hypothetical protein